MPRIDKFEGLEHFFTYHKPKGDQPNRYELVRLAGFKMAQEIMLSCPESAERTLALRDVQRAVMMANAAIALNE